MKNSLKQAISRVILLILPIAVQIAVITVVLLEFSAHSTLFYLINGLMGVVLTLVIIESDRNPAYKLAWIIPMLTVPIFGVIAYLLFGRLKKNPLVKIIVARTDDMCREQLPQDGGVMSELSKKSPVAARQAKYLSYTARFPVYKNSNAEYFSLGEYKFAALLEELKKAEHYIFLEYFIIQEGKMWNSILEILGEKAAEGVDVRVLYDDLGSMFTIPYRFSSSLRSKGIKCMAFNRCVPLLSVIMNNRDHRKIVVIDGHTAFTGGINLADEYINEYEKHGHWKDTAVMIRGEAVWSFTVMFLSAWESITGKAEDLSLYRPHRYHEESFESDGYILPYSDSPLDGEPVGETAYLGVINSAKDYVYINTPYLILDNELATALCSAAKSGVDVRITTPHIPDKKIIFLLTRSYYSQLIEAGVKIYEYTPGFVHAKSFVSDDETAIVGTINLDYRSLYLHFECAAWLHGCRCIADIKRDFLDTLEKCTPVSAEDCKRMMKGKRLILGVLKIFAPLM